ncbi:MAG: hypothetical protein LBD36_02305, partial [Holosporales bacterium]|nr:hypothetical protein [Holosporales bacterium]
MQTVLTLSVGGLPPMSARGCIQELKTIPQGEFQRTINGGLMFLGNADHKYYSKIICTDQTIIATEGLKIGDEVTVGCIQSLCQKILPNEYSVVLSRTPVHASVNIVDEQRSQFLDFKCFEKNVVIEKYHDTLFIFYNPRLQMRIISFSLTIDEWKM